MLGITDQDVVASLVQCNSRQECSCTWPMPSMHDHTATLNIPSYYVQEAFREPEEASTEDAETAYRSALYAYCKATDHCLVRKHENAHTRCCSCRAWRGHIDPQMVCALQLLQRFLNCVHFTMWHQPMWHQVSSQQHHASQSLQEHQVTHVHKLVSFMPPVSAGSCNAGSALCCYKL